MALIPNFIKETSSANYTMGMFVQYKDFDSVHATCMIGITPCLRKNNGNYRRKQHNWRVTYYIDFVEQKPCTFTGWLPNDLAAPGVVSKGELLMISGAWYEWGPTQWFTMSNDGGKHSFSIRMECFETVPYYCPSVTDYLTAFIQFPDYSIIPPKPSGLEVNFNEDTRELTYTWNDADCAFITLWREWYTSNEEGAAPINAGFYIVGARPNCELYNADKPLREILPDDVCKVVYEMYNYSGTGSNDRTTDGAKAKTIPTGSKVWVNVDGVWRKATPWVKVNGVWRKATKAYIKINNTWNRTMV